jgi:hypothetical protein
LVDHPWRGQAIAPQSRDEGLGGPVSERRIGFQPGTAASPATQTSPQGRQWLLLQDLHLPQRLSAARPQAHPHQAASGRTGAAMFPKHSGLLMP